MHWRLEPYVDELLYGTVARVAYRYGYRGPKRLQDAAWGSRNAAAVPDLPTNLAVLADRRGSPSSAEIQRLALDHTMVGYHTHFLGEQRRQEVLQAMAEGGRHLQVRLGVCAGSARMPNRFRLCLRCREEDLARHGEAYWHRIHHLPGVVVCAVHGDVLYDSPIPYRPVGRHEHLPVPLQESLTNLRPVAVPLTRPEVARDVAILSAELLSAPARTDGSWPDYRVPLALCGFNGRRGGAEPLRAAFINHFGPDLLRASFREPASGDLLGWLAEVLRRPRRPMHPLRHVLLLVFLDARIGLAVGNPDKQQLPSGKTWGLYRSEALRREAASLARMGMTTHAVATALEVDWKTAKRLLDPLPGAPEPPERDLRADRQAWAALAASHPLLGKKGLRGVAPALYARLYRNDRDWLLAWRGKAAAAAGRVRRVDWGSRDASVEALVRQQAAETSRQVPARRVSRSHVLGVLGLRALVAHRGALLPRTLAALSEVCETVEAFQLRRLTAVIQQETRPLPDWQLLRKARIQASRAPDTAARLLASAHSQVATARQGASR